MSCIRARTHVLGDGREAWHRVYNPLDGMCVFQSIDDWSVPGVNKAEWAPLSKIPQGPHQQKVVNDNVAAHAPLISPHTALHSWAGTRSGTCVVVAPGPSSAGITVRLERLRAANPEAKFDVCALNRAGMAPRLKPDYFCVIDALSKPEWWKGIDPAQTTLLTVPMTPKELAAHWTPKGGETPNVKYAYMRDCGDSAQDVFEPLEIVFGAHSVPTVAVHMLSILGYKRLVFVGLDMAFGKPIADEKGEVKDAVMYGDGLPGSRTYAGGELSYEVVGIDGKLCLTTRDLMAQRPAVMCAFEIAADMGVECVNASGRGILDWNVKSLDEAILAPFLADEPESVTLSGS